MINWQWKALSHFDLFFPFSRKPTSRFLKIPRSGPSAMKDKRKKLSSSSNRESPVFGY
jgi:hypothetical protein